MKKTKPTKAAKTASKPTKPAKTAAPAKAKAPAKAAKAAAPAKPAKAAKPVAPAKTAKAPAKPVKAVKAAAPAKPVKAAKPAAPAKAPAPAKVPAKVAKSSSKETSAKETIKDTTKDVVAKAPKKEVAPKVEAKPVYIPEEPDVAEEVVLTDADGRRYCRTKDCDRLAEVDNYCRYHYILLWKNIQVRRNILQEGKLGRYIEELTARYPDKFLEILKKDLRSEKDFLAAIQELEIDESAVEAEFDDEESQSDLFEIQRVSDAGNSGDRSDSDDRF